MSKALILILAVLLVACADNNSEAKYGKTGLSANCRAYVQASVDEWRTGANNTDDTMNALERNCGVYGTLWDYRP